MGFSNWLQRQVLGGEVLQDYGILHDRGGWYGRLRTSLLLCRRKGKLQLVVKIIGTAPLGASMQFIPIDVTPESLQKFQAALADARKLSGGETLFGSVPPVIGIG